MTDEHDHAAELAELTADVVSAYVDNHPSPAASLQDLIASVYSSLPRLGGKTAPPAEKTLQR